MAPPLRRGLHMSLHVCLTFRLEVIALIRVFTTFLQPILLKIS